MSLIINFALAACTYQPPQPTQQNNSSSPSKSEKTTNSKLTEVGTQIKYVSGYSQSVTEKGYYYIDNRQDSGANIYYLDFDTQQVVVLCSRAECLHNDYACTGWIANPYNSPRIITAQNKLILVYPGNALNFNMDPSTIFPHIDIMDLNGSNKQTLATFKSNMMFTDFFAIDNEYLYYQIDIYDSESKVTHIEKMNLNTGKTSVIKDFSSRNVFLMGAGTGNLYLKEISFDKSITNERDKFNNQIHDVINLSVSNGQEDKVISWIQGARQELFDNESMLYVSETYEIRKVSFNNKEDTIIVPSQYLSDFISQKSDNSANVRINFQILLIKDDFIFLNLTFIGETPLHTKNVLVAIDVNNYQITEIPLTTKNNLNEMPLEIRAVSGDNIVVVSEYINVSSAFIASDGTVYPLETTQPVLSVENFKSLIQRK